MRTHFSKRLIASGLIAAVGANLIAAGPAFAGPDGDRNYQRQDTRKDGRHDDNRGRNAARQDDRRGPSKAPHAPAPQAQRGPSQPHQKAPTRAPVAHADHRAPAVKVVTKPAVVHREVARSHTTVKVVERPVAVHRDVVRAPRDREDRLLSAS